MPLAKQGLTTTQLAEILDTATAAQVAQWQTGIPNDWLFESHQIETQVYDDRHSRRKLKNDYYERHISTINRRIYMAGIRLADVPNRMFKVYTTLKERMVELGPVLTFDLITSILLPLQGRYLFNNCNYALITKIAYSKRLT